MTSLLEKTISIIAPHRCILCGNYNNILCDACLAQLPKLQYSICALCGEVSEAWQLCEHCRAKSALSGIWVAGNYEGVIKQLVVTYKFEHARAAHLPMARYIADTLPFLDDEWIITTIPTAPAHIRARSFDHSRLLAQEVAQRLHRTFEDTLVRKQNVQQVGKGRVDRIQQATQAFELHPRIQVSGRRVLVVDDICTTGATLSAAAALLIQAGAREAWGVVAARVQPNRAKQHA